MIGDANEDKQSGAAVRERQGPRESRQKRSTRVDINGWINLDKPTGISSTQAVGRIKFLFNAKKAGHAGTLDPLASGVLPIALGDGVSFSATADDVGRPLDGRCDVEIEGITPQARFWTLTLYGVNGELVANSVDRHGFTSEEIVRRSDGSFAITVGPRASAGNWLPTGGIERYQVALRFYDTAVGVSTKAGREVPMPSVVTRSCP